MHEDISIMRISSGTSIQHSTIYFVQSTVNGSFRRLRFARLDTAIVSRVFPCWAAKRVAQATGLSSLRRARERITIECNFHFQSSYERV